jgi:hypothetical protein
MGKWTNDRRVVRASDKRPFRPGKTKADHASGAWANHNANRAAKADENRGGKRTGNYQRASR